ncbi:type VI secretion system-associated FHA domain protein TagH [Pseudoduganella sp. OTU4001]|uniref:type VI secretion system-associated FHA domain protein TagH n=1 Tax=Pseudoduganella sp. OTU4001 TaxID=3043854 RepID=UPI00313F2ECF
MIMIKAVSYNGQPPTAPLVGEFGEAGGVIGRSDDNALVLPDPERYVSRAHATVAYRGGTYVIRDLSSASPVYVNGRALGNGNEADLLDGDELRIGAYTLQVIGEPAAQKAPVDDPMNLFGGAGGMSNDFNLFGGPSAPRAPEPAKEVFSLGLGGGADSDINQMFGLGGGAASNPFPAGHPLSGDGVSRGTGASVDPLVVFGAAKAPEPSEPSQRNDTPEIRGAFTPPQVTPPGNGEDSKSMLVSWGSGEEQESGDGIKTLTVPSPSSARKERKEPVLFPPLPPEAAPPAANAATPAPASVPAVVADAKPGAARAPAARSAAAGKVAERASEDNGELMRAFLGGAGVPDLEMKGPLDALAMQMLGHLLREATQGTLDLLKARALLKREIRAEMTMIRSEENNPLKFSPNVDVALAHLLAPRGQGFLPPLPAMKDAYDDLRAHEFAFMAGMRAALAGVLLRFNPAQLEKRLSEKSVVDTLLPMNRKAKLWSLYGELYADITREAEDDFHSLFGKAFLAAYEAQLDKLQQDGNESSH